MAPHSPGTDQIHTLLWIGYIAAAIVVIAVNVALFYALRRYRAERGSQPRQSRGGRRIQFRVGGVLTVFAAAILVLSIVFTEKAREIPTTGPAGLASARSQPLTIQATGRQWLWRYNYPNGAFSYYKLVVPVDTAIALDLFSTDVVHTWDVPELAPQREAVPGKPDQVVFRADEEGTYTGQASTMSGQGYAAMRTEVDVVSPQAYLAFIKAQKTEVQAAQNRVIGMVAGGKVP
ncbi:MAG TPA: cytochrome c oxidase subunit II [Solirubrobacterales bacterium]|nr:cytochrome c oxidase subunit II [Solirubrobacterales bacterium]